MAWSIVQALLIRPSPPRAYAWRRFWLRLFGAKISPCSGTRPTTRIVHPWLLEIGDHSIIGDEVLVYNLGRISIGNHSVISQRTHLCAGTHDHTQPDLPLRRSTIQIGSGVWICADAFIGPDVSVGDNALVAARTVVTRDVEPATIVAGNPARFIKARPMNASAHDAATFI
ncbi:MAG: putative colanic acid biosynthesis acetyltransferase [Phycisphaeraceae bacterium]|nr:putative colanic acid biosynthesis acetyltransferase [Phycisphaeraceae bacterium]